MLDPTLTTRELFILVRDARSLSLAQRLTVNALILRCNPDQSYSVRMSIKDLENDTGLSDRAITRAIGSMIQSGYLRKVPSPSKRPNLYFIEVAPFAEQAAKNRAEDSAHADATSEQEGDHV